MFDVFANLDPCYSSVLRAIRSSFCRSPVVAPEGLVPKMRTIMYAEYY
jgi:hypothetical protein